MRHVRAEEICMCDLWQRYLRKLANLKNVWQRYLKEVSKPEKSLAKVP